MSEILPKILPSGQNSAAGIMIYRDIEYDTWSAERTKPKLVILGRRIFSPRLDPASRYLRSPTILHSTRVFKKQREHETRSSAFTDQVGRIYVTGSRGKDDFVDSNEFGVPDGSGLPFATRGLTTFLGSVVHRLISSRKRYPVFLKR